MYVVGNYKCGTESVPKKAAQPWVLVGQQYYAMERFLYRLSKSDYVGKYILKGALMLRVWHAPFARPTMDIDMLGKTSNDIDAVVGQFKDICDVIVEPDGLTFNPDSIRAQRITEDADYEGLRLRFTGNLGNAKINIQIDIGFGDVVFPKPKSEALPTILDFAPPKLSCYSRESVVAEKFEAMIRHSDLNSRMKTSISGFLPGNLVSTAPSCSKP